MRRLRAMVVTGLMLSLAATSGRAESVPEAALPTTRPLWKWEQPTVAEWTVHGTAIGLIWTDVLLSRHILRRDPTRVETNALFSPHPSDAEWFLKGGLLPTVVLTAIWYALPHGWRNIPSGSIALMEVGNIATLPGL